MRDVYALGTLINATVFGIGWLFLLLKTLLIRAKAFVHDERFEAPYAWMQCRFIHGECSSEALLVLWLGPIFSMLLALIWPVTVPALIGLGCLYALRSAIRFKKIYKAHKHDPKTGEVMGESGV